MIFDAIPIEEFLAEGSTKPLYERRYVINKAINCSSTPFQYVKWNPGRLIATADELEDIMAEYLEQGYEGVVIKDLDATYKFKRSKDWIKHKPWIDVDVPIVGFADGEGKWTGGLGAVIIEGGEEGVGRTEVGSGLTDEMHKYIWEHRQELLGTLVEVRYQNKTPDGKLRFPVFRRLRTDRKAVEKK
jgi:ATP-dependent DNA ligase